MKYTIKQTDTYRRWERSIRDRVALLAIMRRLKNIQELGLFGNYKLLGGALAELKIDVGQGYRIYYTVRQEEIVLLLAGGNKKSQEDDIKNARNMIKQLEK